MLESQMRQMDFIYFTIYVEELQNSSIILLHIKMAIYEKLVRQSNINGIQEKNLQNNGLIR